jgi:hypothetical protein
MFAFGDVGLVGVIVVFIFEIYANKDISCQCKYGVQ